MSVVVGQRKSVCVVIGLCLWEWEVDTVVIDRNHLDLCWKEFKQDRRPDIDST